MNSKDISDVPPSKFNPVKEVVEEIDIKQILDIDNKFWSQQSVELHSCYKKGNVYANNSQNKSSADILADLLIHLKNSCKDGKDKSINTEIVFNIILDCVKLLDRKETLLDKNCLLATLQGYVLGCLKNYEK